MHASKLGVLPENPLCLLATVISSLSGPLGFQCRLAVWCDVCASKSSPLLLPDRLERRHATRLGLNGPTSKLIKQWNLPARVQLLAQQSIHDEQATLLHWHPRAAAQDA